MSLLMDIKYYKDSILRSLKGIDSLTFLENKSILITGATGLICSGLIDQLLCINELYDYKIKIYACSRFEENIISRFGKNYKDRGITFIEYNYEKIDFNLDVDYIIHGASSANPNLYVTKPVDTMLSNFIGMKNLLEYSKINKKVDSIVYISSSEIYGISDLNCFEEHNYGIVDILNTRSSYSISKRATETLCYSYAKQYNINVKIARPGHIFGPSARKDDTRLASDFLFKSINKENLVLKSSGIQKRSYLYSLDCSSALLYILLKGEKGQAYNVSSENNNITIRDLSKIISDLSEVNLTIEESLGDSKENPMKNSILSDKKIRSLGWNSQFSIKESLEITYKTLKELNHYE